MNFNINNKKIVNKFGGLKNPPYLYTIITNKTNIMNTQQQINLVCGATEAQLKRIKNMQNVQKAYMEFVQNNPSLDIKIYESKYSELMADVNN